MKIRCDVETFLPRRANAILFYGLTVALLVPLWGFKYFPSQDGPLHQYNAVVLRDYHRPDRPGFGEYFVPNLALVPNWLCPHVLPILVRFCSSIVAEKLLLSAYLLLFPISVRFALGAIRPRGRLLSLAILPMVPNQFYHLGFHDFCLSLAGYFFVVGYFLKHRRSFRALHAIVLTAMLLGLYITHLVSVVMVLALIGLCGLSMFWGGSAPMAQKIRRMLPIVGAMVPVVLWAAYFALKPHRGSELAAWPKGWYHRLFLVPLWMKSFQYYEAIAGFAMLMLLVAGTIWLLRSKRRRIWLPGLPGGLLATVVFYAFVFLVAPDAYGGAQVLLIRVAAFVFFATLLWWASLPLGSRAFSKLELAVAIVSVPAALGLLVSHVRSYAELNKYLTAFEAVAPLIPPGATLVPIHFNDPYTLSAPTAYGAPRHLLSSGIDPFRHASTFGLAEGGVIDLGNSWANTDHQSLRWQPGLEPMTLPLDRVDDFIGYTKRTGRPVDYVLIWTGGIGHNDAQGELIDGELAGGYQLIYTSPGPGYLRLYRSLK